MIKKLGTQLKIAAASTLLEDIVVEHPVKPTPGKVIEQKRADFLYFRARAISAGDQGPVKGQPNYNGNGDFFSRLELETSYPSFVGRNLFLNHESDSPIKSVGKVIDAYPVEDSDTGEFYIETLSKIDRKCHPEIARKVETGELNTVSMGCSCESSTCSVCGTVIHTESDPKCEHLEPTGLLKSFRASVDFPEYGIKQGEMVKAFAINKGITFNELSIVNVPADSRAVIKTVIANLRKEFSKPSLTKEAQLDLVAKLDAMLSTFDEQTKAEIKTEFCACPSKGGSMAADESKVEKVASEEMVKLSAETEEAVYDELQKRFNARDFMRMANAFQKRVQAVQSQEKPAEVKVAEVKVENQPTVDASLTEKISTQLKETFAWKLFNQAIKRITNEELEKMSAKEPVKETPKVVSAKFTLNPEDMTRSTWTIQDGEDQVLEATLGDIWGEELSVELQADKAWITGEEKNSDGKTYGDVLVAKFTTEGLDKVAALLGLQVEGKGEVKKPSIPFFKPGEDSSNKEHDVKTEYKIKSPGQETAQKGPAAHEPTSVKTEYDIKAPHPGKGQKGPKAPTPKDVETEYKIEKPKGDFIKPGAPNPEEKKHDKSSEEIKTAYVAGEHLESSKTEEEKKEEKKQASQVVEQAPEIKPEATIAAEASAFDKLKDKIILGEGFEAVKDLETKEIIVMGPDGKEVQRFPDGFGDDVASVIKLMRKVLGLKDEEKPAEAPVEEVKVVEEKPVEPVMEPKMDEMPAPDHMSSLSLKEAELAKKEAELKQKEETIAKKEAEHRAAKFSMTVNSRVDACKRIVEAMVDRDMITWSDEELEGALKDGTTLLEARENVMKAAINKQVKVLMAMDDTSLEAFKQSVSNVKKATKKASRIPYMEWTPGTGDDDITKIFKSMGNLKGQ